MFFVVVRERIVVRRSRFCRASACCDGRSKEVRFVSCSPRKLREKHIRDPPPDAWADAFVRTNGAAVCKGVKNIGTGAQCHSLLNCTSWKYLFRPHEVHETPAYRALEHFQVT